VEAYRERLRSLTVEREALRPWQRSRRATIDDLIRQNQDALAEWSADARAAAAQETAATRRAPATVDREALLAPSNQLAARIGPRPDRFGDRETWVRAAVAVMRDPVALRDVPMERPTMNDTGLEL
jgi:hypothetical protein